MTTVLKTVINANLQIVINPIKYIFNIPVLVKHFLRLETMTLFLNRLSKIDTRTKYAVFGWIRNNEKLLELSHIPLLISFICILYFRDDEIFAIIGTKVKLSNNKKCIEK
eukprot:482922_1